MVHRDAAVNPAPVGSIPAPCAPPAPDFGTQLIQAAKAIHPSLVAISSSNMATRSDLETPLDETPLEFLLKGVPMARQKLERRGAGSGVIVDSAGRILTTHHVVEGSDTIKVRLSDGRDVTAKIVGADPRTDLAVLQINKQSPDIQPAALGDSDKLQVGEWVLSCGTPFGMRQSVSAGIISAVGRGSAGIAEYEDFLQTDAAITANNSGGALVNRDGQLIGINTAVASRSSGSDDGIGLVIPINMARKIMTQLLDRGKMVRGDVGVYVSNVSAELAHSFSFRKSGGALVQDITRDATGARAGIEAGDIIVECNNQAISSAADFRNAIANLAPGTKAALQVFRDGKTRPIQVEVAEAPAALSPDTATPLDEPLRWGLELTEITPELKQRLALSSAQGAVISKVIPSSAGDDAGLRAGDLLVSVGDTAVRNAEQARRLMLMAKAPVRLRIVHDGRGMFVIVND
ncbi:MAG TPA: trypsin-like peptidase domain-containing protein [Polyangiales bacterium]|nr:trypsin-like peptidase domain-containing protein [Polyangiales bacterium]